MESKGKFPTKEIMNKVGGEGKKGGNAMNKPITKEDLERLFDEDINPVNDLDSGLYTGRGFWTPR